MAKKPKSQLNGNKNQSINVAQLPNNPAIPVANSRVGQRRRSRSEIRMNLVDKEKDPTKNYQSTRYAYFGELFVSNLPLWRLWTARMMLTSDPIVDFSLNIRNAALMAADVVVTAKRDDVKKWVEDQWRFVWDYHRPQLVSAKRWGFAPLQIKYKENQQGQLDISGVKDFAPEDARALEVSSELCGQRVKGAPMYFPQALWLKFNSEFGSQYGVAVTRRQYPAWYEKWMDHGAKRLQQLRMVKDSYIGDIFWYPPHMKLTLPDGTEVSWRDLLRETAENRLSGAAMTLPRLLDNNGKELTGYSPPQSIAGSTEVFTWVDVCDDNILKGADIPKEVVQAADTGSGFSGRSIPFLVLLSTCTKELVEIVQQVKEQVLRPAAWLNWGGDVEFDIYPKSLVESFAGDISGSQMAGGSIGAPGQEQPPEPQQLPPQQQTKQFEEGSKYSCLLFNLPGDIAFEVRMLGDRIDLADLKDGISSRELNPHITLKWGLQTDNPEEVRKAIDWEGPIACQIGKCSVFSNPTEDVVKLEINSQGLHNLNTSVCKHLENVNTHPEYKPHITIAYCKPGAGAKYADLLNDLEGKVVAFDTVIFSSSTKHRTPINLTGQAQFKEAPALEGENGRPFGLSLQVLQFDEKHVHAPPGGITINGVFYHGGEYIPKHVLAGMSAQEKSQLEFKQKTSTMESHWPLSSTGKHLGGSTGAELVTTASGKQVVRKYGKHAEHIKNEVDTNKLYQIMGVNVPKGSLFHEDDGKPYMLSEYVENAKPLSELKGEERKKAYLELGKHFVADALLANWDVIGQNYDNIVVSPFGTVYRVDNGGSQRFRAQGGNKGDKWNDKLLEIDTMRNTGTAGDVFKYVTDEMVQQQAQDILKHKDKLKAYSNDPIFKARLDHLQKIYGDNPPNDEQVKDNEYYAVGESFLGKDPYAKINAVKKIGAKFGVKFSEIQLKKIALLNDGKDNSKLFVPETMGPTKEEALKSHFAEHFQDKIQVKIINASSTLLGKYKKMGIASLKEVWAMPLTDAEKLLAQAALQKGKITKEQNELIQNMPKIGSPKNKTLPDYKLELTGPHYKKAPIVNGKLAHKLEVGNTDTAEFQAQQKPWLQKYNNTHTAAGKAFSYWKGSGNQIRMYQDGFFNTPKGKVWLEKHTKSLQGIKHQAEAMEAAIAEAPQYNGIMFRGIDHVTPGTEAYEVLKNPGNIVKFKSSAHCSKENTKSLGFGSTVYFRIAARSGADITHVHGHTIEKEVVTPPGVVYRVTAVHHQVKVGGITKVGLFVDLEEVHPGTPAHHAYAYAEIK
jgi:2'-5' RNA ligase